MDDLARRRLMVLFEGLKGVHGTHGEPHRDGLKWSIRKSASTLREPVTEELWVLHLEGKRPLGVVPIREDSTCTWSSIDIDRYDLNLTKLVRQIEDKALPLVPCQSKSGGVHLFMFLKNPEPAAEVIAVLRMMAAYLGFGNSEIFPKQSRVLIERGDFGSWMVMPYFGGNYDGRLKPQVGLKRTGAEMTLSEFVRIAEQRAINNEQFHQLHAKMLGQGQGQQRRKNGAEDGEFADGPPCLVHLATVKVERGGQNNALLHMGIYYKRAFPDKWEDKLTEANQKFLDPPGSEKGLQSVIRSLRKKDYEYTCKAEPMASHCNAGLCRTRTYGVGAGDGSQPRNLTLTLLETVPPVWFADLDDKRIEVTTEQLQSFAQFQLAAMTQIKVTFRQMKQVDWIEVVRVAMENHDIKEAPPDAGLPGQFHELLEEYLTNRSRGTRKEDLLTGRPWEDQDEGRHYFRLSGLRSFLQRQGMRDPKMRELTRNIEALDGGHHFFNFSGKGCNVWWVPSEKIQPTPEIPPAEIPRSPV